MARNIPIIAMPSDDDGVPEGECPHCVRVEKIMDYWSAVMEGENVNVARTVCEQTLAQVLENFPRHQWLKIGAGILEAAACILDPNQREDRPVSSFDALMRRG